MPDPPRPAPPAPLSYDLVRSRRRTLVLHVLPGGRLEVRAPLGLSARRIAEFVASKRPWIERTLAKKAREEPLVLWRDRPLLDGDVVHVRGIPCRLTVTERKRSKNLACREYDATSEMDVLHIPGTPGEPLEPGLLAFYRKDLKERVEAMLPDIAARVGAVPSSIGFRMARTRWGSCSHRGRVGLNLLCAALPDPLLEYILCHELCHLRRLHHGPAFWDALRRVLPDMEARRRALRGWHLR